MTDHIPAIKRAIGVFLRNRREAIGWSVHALRGRTNTSNAQVKAIEEGTHPGMDTYLKLMLTMGLSLHLTEQNADAAEVLLEGTSVPPPYLLASDEAAGQLYVLHWQQPAFLVQVVQTIPHDLRLVATYGAPAEAIHAHHAWKELQAFLDARFSKATN